MAINTVINTNIMALTAHRNLGAVGNRQNKANQRLSSGKKINSAADDAAGLAISEKMKAQIKGLDMASKNSEDAISLIQTAEGSLSEVNNMLTRVRELTVQAANDTNQKEDRVKIAGEVAQLLSEIDSISSRTAFNEKNLNDGSFQNGHFQIGSNSGQKLDLSIGNMSVMGIGADAVMEAFGLEKSVDLDTKSSVAGVVSDGKASSTLIKVADVKIDNNTVATAKLSTANVAFTYKEHGQSKTMNIKVDLSNVQVNANNANKVLAKDIGAALAKELSANSEFSSKFKVKADATSGNLTIETLQNGKEVAFEAAAANFTVKYDDATGTTANASAVTEGTPTADSTVVDGFHNEIDITSLTDGETLTIGGRKYTKVDTANVANTANGFSTADELQDLLKAAGVESTKSVNANTGVTKLSLDRVDPKSELAGIYKTNEKNVSDKGKDYSNLLTDIDEALKNVTTQRAQLGSNQNRLEYTINSLNLSSENLTAAKSRIEDTDMAKEMMNLTSANVLQQAATTILAQANQAPKNINLIIE